MLGLTYEQMDVFANSPVFMFPQMLPEFRFLPEEEIERRVRIFFSESEDKYVLHELSYCWLTRLGFSRATSFSSLSRRRRTKVPTAIKLRVHLILMYRWHLSSDLQAANTLWHPSIVFSTHSYYHSSQQSGLCQERSQSGVPPALKIWLGPGGSQLLLRYTILGGSMLDFQKSVLSGPVQPVRWWHLWSKSGLQGYEWTYALIAALSSWLRTIDFSSKSGSKKIPLDSSIPSAGWGLDITNEPDPFSAIDR